MNNKAILLAMAAATMLAACGQPETENIAAANNFVEAAPVNAIAPAVEDNLSEAGNGSSPAAASPEPRVAPAPQPRTAPAAERQTMPVERRVDRAPPAPKQEPAPAPTSNCTPEHEAMGHCKQ